MLDSTAIGNNIIKNSRATDHSCTRCIAFYKEGTVEYFRKIGCHFPVVSKDIDSDLYKDWINQGVMKCFRCWNINADCSAVSYLRVS
jgi:hypothetical protein